MPVIQGGVVQPGGGVGSTFIEQVTFTETSGAGTYTGTVALPANSSLVDIIIDGIAVWNNAGTATLVVGDGGSANGYFLSTNLKATDLLAGESLSLSFAGGLAGGYVANSQVSPRFSATARSIIGVVTTSSTGGTTGRTRMTVIYTFPQIVKAATKV